MSGFSDSWLALREPLDARSRSAALVRRLSTESAPHPRRIIDLGAGNGSNLRYLAPRLGGEQEWLLVDHDGALLEAAARHLARWATERGLALHEQGETLILHGSGLHCRARRLELDLARDLHALPVDECWLLTASALLDLASWDWLVDLVDRARAADARMLFALTYDGEIGWAPQLSDDPLVTALVNDHQNRDKGFGPALGPRAASAVVERLRHHGYDVNEAETPWEIQPGETGVQQTLIEGWAKAALEQNPEEVERIERWACERGRLVAAGSSRLRVGHRDVLALPSTG